ncbi:CDP-glucose 4,6-dehydratase [Exilibacterium tricleocarpae]|uniref:CDP-glucose 4,6-dehydratase n=1 Tax=Exilibacterium tricleocarpae TaxID=2591008 RepID=A0A545TQG2_9GAMM|nr:CDP-glucose 4,6-dehydratase [Exilibacterium tricleocarpae]TQV79469.1 CDP-glucose 4,6-dehydratase [Exilibacterium tricleocarpae]
MIDPSFWNNRKVFVTGHTGFKGSWLILWLKQLGARVTGYALAPPSQPSMFERLNLNDQMESSVTGDIRDAAHFKGVLQAAKPEIVIHMAAQSLVRDSYLDPETTYATNVMGTVNLLEATRHTSSVKAVLNVTTDKCYENKEWVWGYREQDPLGGKDPYSSSKGCAELVSHAYRNSFLKDAGIASATARAGNVIGGGDWATDRVIPDAIRHFTSDKTLRIRNPGAIRPWQHVLEPLAGYLMLCQQLYKEPDTFSSSWNFGPRSNDAVTVSFLAETLTALWGDQARWKLDTDDNPPEAQYLKLDCSKAEMLLKWQPIWPLGHALKETVGWYKAFYQNEDIVAFTLDQIDRYQAEHMQL